MNPRGLVLWPALALCWSAAVGQAPAAALPASEYFRPGDRVLLRVEGESQLSDTFTVVAGPALPLPGFGDVPLSGVTRAGVESYLTERIGKYFRHATVHARGLVRLSIVGEVEKPGFYAVPADLVLTDALMVTGGPTREAKVKAVRIERDGAALWRGDSLQHALATGLTVDQLRLRDGDQVVFPRASHTGVLPYVGVFLAIPAAAFGMSQLFSHH